MSKNRMISNELMMALIKYHVLDMKNNEEINNLIISELEEKLSPKGLFLTDRFSPGYGDMPFAQQKELCSILDTAKNILKPLECTGTLDGSNSLQHK